MENYSIGSWIRQSPEHELLAKPVETPMILDIGPADKPLEKADLLVDLTFDNDYAREGRPLLTDGKPLIIADVQHLPFRDKAFSFTNCSHVLEHTDQPSLALSEVKRVSRSYYVECPNWIAENIIFGWPFHKWVVNKRNGELVFEAKRERRIFGAKVLPMGYLFHRLAKGKTNSLGHSIFNKLFRVSLKEGEEK